MFPHKYHNFSCTLEQFSELQEADQIYTSIYKEECDDCYQSNKERHERTQRAGCSVEVVKKALFEAVAFELGLNDGLDFHRLI